MNRNEEILFNDSYVMLGNKENFDKILGYILKSSELVNTTINNVTNKRSNLMKLYIKERKDSYYFSGIYVVGNDNRSMDGVLRILKNKVILNYKVLSKNKIYSISDIYTKGKRYSVNLSNNVCVREKCEEVSVEEFRENAIMALKRGKWS